MWCSHCVLLLANGQKTVLYREFFNTFMGLKAFDKMNIVTHQWAAAAWLNGNNWYASVLPKDTMACGQLEQGLEPINPSVIGFCFSLHLFLTASRAIASRHGVVSVGVWTSLHQRFLRTCRIWLLWFQVLWVTSCNEHVKWVNFRLNQRSFYGLLHYLCLIFSYTNLQVRVRGRVGVCNRIYETSSTNPNVKIGPWCKWIDEGEKN